MRRRSGVRWPKLPKPNTCTKRHDVRAYQRVISNQGAPGAEGMTVDEFADYVNQYWPTLKARLLAGEYHPLSVRAVEIPKPIGGTRHLGIPSVMDSLIQ